MLAAEEGHVECIGVLALEAKVNVNAQNKVMHFLRRRFQPVSHPRRSLLETFWTESKHTVGLCASQLSLLSAAFVCVIFDWLAI